MDHWGPARSEHVSEVPPLGVDTVETVAATRRAKINGDCHATGQREDGEEY